MDDHHKYRRAIFQLFSSIFFTTLIFLCEFRGFNRHVFIGNQFTQYKGSAKAFKGMSNAVLKSIYDGYCKEPSRYTLHKVINAEEDFHSAFVYELRDFNSAGVVAAHQGRLLENLQETTYEVHGESVQLDKRRIQECSSSVDKIVKML